MTAPLIGSWRGLPPGEQARRAVVVTTVGSWALAAVLATVAVLRPFDPPYWAFGLPSLVPLVALVVLWRPERRVQDAWLHLGFGAFLLGLFGAAWGAFWSLPVGGAVLLAMALAPRARTPRRTGARR